MKVREYETTRRGDGWYWSFVAEDGTTYRYTHKFTDYKACLEDFRQTVEEMGLELEEE